MLGYTWSCRPTWGTLSVHNSPCVRGMWRFSDVVWDTSVSSYASHIWAAQEQFPLHNLYYSNFGLLICNLSLKSLVLKVKLWHFWTWRSMLCHPAIQIRNLKLLSLYLHSFKGKEAFILSLLYVTVISDDEVINACIAGFHFFCVSPGFVVQWIIFYCTHKVKDKYPVWKTEFKLTNSPFYFITFCGVCDTVSWPYLLP